MAKFGKNVGIARINGKVKSEVLKNLKTEMNRKASGLKNMAYAASLDLGSDCRRERKFEYITIDGAKVKKYV
jgi:hypothetical protein